MKPDDVNSLYAQATGKEAPPLARELNGSDASRSTRTQTRVAVPYSRRLRMAYRHMTYGDNEVTHVDEGTNDGTS